MAEIPLFTWRVGPDDLTPAVLLALPEEEQTERWAIFLADLEDFLSFFAQARAS